MQDIVETLANQLVADATARAKQILKNQPLGVGLVKATRKKAVKQKVSTTSPARVSTEKVNSEPPKAEPKAEKAAAVVKKSTQASGASGDTLSVIATNPGISISDLATKLGMPKPQAAKHVAALIEGGAVRREGAKRWTRYHAA